MTDEPTSTSSKHPDEARIMAFVRNEVDAIERTAIADHLETCSKCHDLARELHEPVPPRLLSFGRQTIARSKPSSKWPLSIGAFASVAAAVTFAVLSQRSDPLPPYELAGPFGAEQSIRGSSDHSHVFIPGNRIEVVLTPVVAVPAETVELAVYVEYPSQGLVRATAPSTQVTITPLGAFRYRAPVDELFKAGDGLYILHTFVGTSRRWPARAPTATALEDELGALHHHQTPIRFRSTLERP